MLVRESDPALQPALEQVLGYLNFATGQSDPAFLSNLNRIFAAIEEQLQRDLPPTPHPSRIGDGQAVKYLELVLNEQLVRLQRQKASFAQAGQGFEVLRLVFRELLPAYRQFHADLLFHQTQDALFRPFFIGRACEAVLRQGAPWNDDARIVAGAIAHLNDFVGHRPVAVLERTRHEPYPHEFVRPIPIYIRGAGVACGRHQAVTELALQILRDADENLLREACFDPELLDELALDPRAYDFDHPANKRPNYHFGQWDPHCIDNRGYYRRFVIQEVTFDSLLERVNNPRDLPPDELLFEGAAVLAGTILMAAGISGRGPDTHDSSVTLATLLPRIAAYRDAFYERLIARMQGPHAARLKAEAAEKRQPFGGARQHLNAQLARRRATQLEHVHLAKVFARMGYPEEAHKEAAVVPVASARLLCQIDCLLTAGNRAIDAGEPRPAADLLPQIVELLHRGIACGAIVDPWNILGFDAHYSLFPAAENSIRDTRIDELVATIEQTFGLYARAWSEAAAKNDRALCQRLRRDFRELVDWWRQFAAHEVRSVDGTRADDAFSAGQHVAEALGLWHQGGAKTGDVRFWSPYTEMFDSPKAYSLVVEALIERGDFVASQGLLMHWLGRGETIGLEKADSSFPWLCQEWLRRLRGNGSGPAEIAAHWPLVRRFLDYLDANAESFGAVPSFALANGKQGPGGRPETKPDLAAPHSDEEDEEAGDLYRAAYDEVVYRDSTDDGVEGSIFEPGQETEEELERELRRLTERLEFHNTLARLWKSAALWPRDPEIAAPPDDAGGVSSSPARTGSHARGDVLRQWARQATERLTGFLELLTVVAAHPLPKPSGDQDSLIEYDRRRVSKDTLLERIINACLEMADAARLCAGAAERDAVRPLPSKLAVPAALQADWPGRLGRDENGLIVASLGQLLRRDVPALRALWPELLELLGAQPLLYVPLARGGDPLQIVAVRARQRALQQLLAWLPRLGLLRETCQLLEIARHMERHHPVGPAAVTEYDALFEIGFRALVSSLIAAAADWRDEQGRRGGENEVELVGCLDQLARALLVNWRAHSSTLRLSVLEKVSEKKPWDRLVRFIERYGADLFTQRFLNPGNLRAILHQGVESWIKRLEEEPHDEPPFKFLQDLGGRLPREEAVQQLTLALEAIVENYVEYRDYNSTTTQSDRGELLYMLLDFLRLRVDYDRVAWNLKPMVLAHELLVRRGSKEAAELWRRQVRTNVSQEATRLLARLVDLQKKYAMRMPTVADRLGEQFLRPMTIDRIRALVAPAMEAAQRGAPSPEFKQLVEETELLMQTPSGVGLDVPQWLLALEEEVDRLRDGGAPTGELAGLATDIDLVLPQTALSLEEVIAQLADLSTGEEEPRKKR